LGRLLPLPRASLSHALEGFLKVVALRDGDFEPLLGLLARLAFADEWSLAIPLGHRASSLRTMNREHLLRDAYLRVDRAGEHIAELDRVIEESAQQKATAVLVYTEEEWDPKAVVPDPPQAFAILQRCAVVAGEVIYNMRAALDYLVYALAILDRPQVRFPEKTQFPIDDSPEQFIGHRGSYLNGVSDVHATAIATLQPYYGCVWTRTLRSLSNRDKHRSLSLTTSWGSFVTEVVRYPITSAEFGTPVAEVHVKADQPLKVFLHEGGPEEQIVETLQILQSEVASVLDAFKPEFE
jgi:hypothetical protein